MLSSKIKSLRQSKGLSQQEVANALNIAPNTYSLIENGKTKLDLERIYQLCKFFEIEPEELFSNGVSVSFNDKVQNRYSYIENIETLHSDNMEIISLMKDQMKILEKTQHQLDSIFEHLIGKRK